MAHRPLKRPYRIWDEAARLPLPWRCYSTPEHAVNKALVLTHWDLKIGNAYTVYDDRTGHVERQFAKRLNGEHVIIVEME